MAFAYTITGAGYVGNRRTKRGTFTNGASDVGGSIVTGLKKIETYNFHVTSHSDVGTIADSVSAGSLVMVIENAVSGTWDAIGI